MPELAHTSVPLWAVGQGPSGPDLTPGSSYVLVGVGAGARPVVDGWAAQAGSAPEGAEVTTVLVDDPDDPDDLGPAVTTAADRLRATLSEARVGVRVRIAGAAGACLALRGAAVSAGLEDDEIEVATVGAGPVELFCVHCRETTAVTAGVGDVAPCGACGRDLLVYHHVSRLSGRFLGFMVDAERPAEGLPARPVPGTTPAEEIA